MIFRQVLYKDLGCASYLLGDGGEAVVVDPRFHVEAYIEIAREEGLRIAHVIDTHDHADHISGRERLAALTGARSHRPSRAEDPRHDDIAPDDELRVGNIHLKALATPGHRPEHLALLVSDLSRSPDPWLVLTGDSLLVGDLARPDLAIDAQDGACDLHASIRRLLELADHVEVWPAHIGGSLCGGAGLSGKPSSTIGFERRNSALLSLPEPEFVEGITASIPARPPNVADVVEANRRTHPALPAQPPLLEAARLLELLAGGVTVLDARDPAEFDSGHIAGALNLPVSASALGTRAGWALRPSEAIMIAARDEARASAMTRALHAVGLWRILGVALDWDGAPIVAERAWALDELALGLRERSVSLVDVREPSEWIAGHVPGSIHMPLGRLGDGRHIEVPDPRGTVAVACAAGVRAAFAASLLRRGGWHEVVRVADGGVGNLPALGVALVGGAD